MIAAPTLNGVIDRRLLINYAVEPDVVARLLPAPFRPQLVAGRAVAGICLIRLTRLRPAGLPALVGLRSENAAHRVAVEWDGPDGARTGVFIPRRDSASRLNVAVGGRIFPGVHHLARFEVEESPARLHVGMRTADRAVEVDVEVDVADDASDALVGSRVFPDLAAASEFFKHGCDGYSATDDPGRFDGLQLRTDAWAVSAASIRHVRSSFFDDLSLFPAGSAVPDNALVMRQVPVTWRPLPTLDVGRRPVPAGG